MLKIRIVSRQKLPKIRSTLIAAATALLVASTAQSAALSLCKKLVKKLP
jgi:hypothetical protein